MKNILLIALSVAITGCAGAPVGYGGTYDVLHKDDQIITIMYDAVTEKYDDVIVIAKEHCGSMDKTPIVQNVHKDPLTFGLIKTYTFKCI